MKLTKSGGDIIIITISYTVVIALGFVTFYPFWDLLITSISPKGEALSAGWKFFTLHPELTAYKQVLSAKAMWRSLAVSVFRVVVGTTLSVFLTAMTAYPLSKRDFPLNKLFTVLVIITMYFGGGLIPTYMFIKSVGLINSVWSLILPSAVTAYNLIIMRNFLRTIPESIEESAIIDGANDFTIWRKLDEAFTRKLVFPVLSQYGGNGGQEFIEGSGPYKYESMDDSGIVLVRNDKWWGDNPPYIDSVIFKICGEDEMLDAFQNNEADISFIRNVDFTRFEHRTDLNFQVYPDNEGNFLYVNPDSLFGQLNRQKALFRYVINRIRDINLGRIQYFDEYDDTPIDTEEFRNALIQSGLYWNEIKKSFTYQGKSLNAVSIVVPKQDLQKLYTANFLVTILEDAGIPAEVKSVSAQEVKRAIQNGSYDLSPVTEEIKPWETLDDTLKRMQQQLGYGVDNSYILPLYRNQQAVLFRNYIRGEKKATFWNPYLGFQEWYIPVFTKSSLK